MAEKNVNINLSVKTQNTRRKLQEVNKQLQRVSVSANRAGASGKRMGAGFRSTIGTLSAFTGGMVALGSAFRVFSFGVRQMVEFEKTMSAVQAVSSATETQFKALSNEARKLGATTSFSASEAADGLKFLAMAGFDVNEQLSALEPTLQLAKAGAMDLGRAADIVSNIMRAMNMEASRTAEAGDILAQAARNSNTSIEQLGDAFKYAGGIAGNLGLSLEETTAVLSTLSNAGMQASMAGTGLRQVLVKLANPSKNLREVFDSVGVNVDDLDISANNLVPTLRKLQQAGLSTGEIFKAFEARAGTAFSIMMGGIDDMEKLERANKSANGTLEEMSEVMANNLATSGKLLQSAFSELFISQNEFHNGLRTVVDTLTMAINIFNGTATSVDKYGNSNRELIVNANKLILALKGVGIVLAGLALGKFIAMIVKSSTVMALFGVKTTYTTTALVAQDAVVKSTSISGFALMSKKLAMATLGMKTLAGASRLVVFAVKGIALAIASTGIGFLIVGVGMVISKYMQWKAESKATRDAAIADAKAIAGEIETLTMGYDKLEEGTKKVGTANEDEFSRGSQKVMELIGHTSRLKEKLQKLKPPKLTDLSELSNFQQLEETLDGLNKKLAEQKRALSQMEIGSDDEAIANTEHHIKLTEDFIKLYKEHGVQIIAIREEEQKRNSILEKTSEFLRTNSRLVANFAEELRSVENAEVKASIEVNEAEARFRADMEKLVVGVSDMAGRKGGNELIDKIQDQLNKGDIKGVSNIKGLLEVGIKTGDLEGAEDVLPKFEENVKNTREELLKLAGGAEGASRQMMKAVTQLAVIKELGEVRGGFDNQKIFSFITKEINNAEGDISRFEERIERLREIEDLQTTIAFQDKTSNELAKVEANLAKAKLELISLNAEFENSSRLSNKTANAMATVGNIMAELGVEQGEDTSTVDAFDIRGIENFEQQVKDEKGIMAGRIADTIRAISTIERLQKTRRALTETQGEGADDSVLLASKTAGEALRESFKNKSGDIEDVISLALMAGITESGDAFKKLLTSPETSAEELNQVFSQLATFAERARQETTKRNMEMDGIADKAREIADLERNRTNELQKQQLILQQQQQEIQNIQKQGEIDEMKANLAMGAGGVTQADIDLAEEIMEGEAKIERFARKLKSAIEKSTEVEIAIKRTELEGDKDKSTQQKRKELAEFEDQLAQKRNQDFSDLVEKQRRIFQQVKFAEQVDKAVKSFGQQIEKFEKARKGRQEEANEFARNAIEKLDANQEDDKDTGGREAGVSSLAQIGGGGGVGRGAGAQTEKDIQRDIKDLNEEQLRVLNEIAKDKFGVAEFADLGQEDQDKLIAAQKRLNDLVQKRQAGGIGVAEVDAEMALRNIGALLAQEQTDKDLAEVAQVRDLANLGGDEINQKAPKALENDQVAKLVKDFSAKSAKQQVLTIKKLEEDGVDRRVIDALKEQASKGQEARGFRFNEQFNENAGRKATGEHDFEEQARRADNIFEAFKDLENAGEVIDPDMIRSTFREMVGNMDAGAERLAQRLDRELNIPVGSAQDALARERVEKAVQDTKGTDMALDLDALPDDLDDQLPDMGDIDDDLPPLPPLPDLPNLPNLPPLENVDDPIMAGLPPLPPLADLPDDVQAFGDAFAPVDGMAGLPDPEVAFGAKPEEGEAGLPPLPPLPEGMEIPPPPAHLFDNSDDDQGLFDMSGLPPLPPIDGEQGVIQGDDRVNESNRLLKEISGKLSNLKPTENSQITAIEI